MAFAETDCGPRPQDMYATIISPVGPTTVGSTVTYQCIEAYALNTTDEQKEFKYTRYCNITEPLLNLPGPVEWLESPVQCEGIHFSEQPFPSRSKSKHLVNYFSILFSFSEYLTCNYN